MGSVEKTLVLAIDFDDDLGRVGIKTPVLGYEGVLRAAERYALARPQDADLNTLFTALRVYRELKEDGRDVDVAIVAGHEKGGSRAGLKLREQLQYVINASGATSAVVVVDSAEDESVMPIVESMIKVAAVEKVVVEQLRGVEETYVLLGRYLKKALEEKRFARFFLGLPGLLILTYVVVANSPYSRYASAITLTILGLAFIVKGFGISSEISKWWRISPIMKVSIMLTLISLSLTAVITYTTLYSRDFSTDILSIAMYINNILPYAIVSAVPIIAGRMAFRILRRSFKVWREVMALAILAIIYQFFSNMARIIIDSGTTNLSTIMKLLNENYLIQTLILYIGIIMTVSVTMYAIEKELI